MSLAKSLTALLQAHGSDLLRERERLFDRAAGWAERERILLTTAWRSGVAGRLLRDGGEPSQRQAVKVLTDEFSLSPEAALEIVGALAQALGRPVTVVLIEPVSAIRRFWRGLRVRWKALAVAAFLAILGMIIAWSLWWIMDLASIQAAQKRRDRFQYETERVSATSMLAAGSNDGLKGQSTGASLRHRPAPEMDRK
ncbi:MAG: hypothetical protein JZU52_03515 [Lamprocystis purpurea]|jgi:hypothetical protein|uniref:hypothetical protein n=1 Tax=Lamprocystis purpurea TaxID=61598 RepID=UPI00037ACDCE|nr:hypothetical protein [Lamprocystis purpurea]MBV5272736.1 hypothetical protein [Lamprocystis purpurea]